MQKEPCFLPACILLPDAGFALDKWACVACDQFTSDPAYWARAEAAAADAPSTLHLILPEVYLEAPDKEARVERVHQAMPTYLEKVLTRQVNGFVYVERTLQSGRVRQGLVGVVDLEAYSYEKGAKPPIRPSENTVVERIPPRLAVRRGAVLETPHVMMLADDPACTLIEPIAAAKAELPLLYAGELMLGGGHIAGWAVEDETRIQNVLAALTALGGNGPDALKLAVGDGNHSLATAKAHWQELKAALPAEALADHPARYCLAEVCNVESDAIEIEPIHRAFFGVEKATVLAELSAWAAENNLDLTVGPAAQTLTLVAADGDLTLGFAAPKEPLTVGSAEAFVGHLLAACPDARVDYIHDEPALRALCAKGAVGLLLPEFAKSDLFRGVIEGGVLPRKTFSMGHAEEKRYYLECRAILPRG